MLQSAANSSDQRLKVFARELRPETDVLAENGRGKLALLLLQLEDLLFYGVAGDKLVRPYLTTLADPVSTVDSLGFDGGVPPGIEQEHVLGRREVHSDTPCT